MRHLRVPSTETSAWRDVLLRHGWLAEGTGILAVEADRLLPLSDEAPEATSEVWKGHAIEEHDPLLRGPSHWSERVLDHLPSHLHGLLPTSHEVVGDVLLVKLEEALLEHGRTIAEAMLQQLPHVRLVCQDRGVHGPYRVRDLAPLAVREGDASTVTEVKEHGLRYILDPARVYFSARLSGERARSASVLEDHATHLGRPLVVYDPYAGVGPNLGLPLHRGLIRTVVAGDLNPAAASFLEANLERLAPSSASLRPTVRIEVGDGRAWRAKAELLGRADALFLNLPHEATEHVADLLPLLAEDAWLLGWVIADRDSAGRITTELEDVHQQASRHVQALEVALVKGYSTSMAIHRIAVRSTTGS